MPTTTRHQAKRTHSTQVKHEDEVERSEKVAKSQSPHPPKKRARTVHTKKEEGTDGDDDNDNDVKTEPPGNNNLPAYQTQDHRSGLGTLERGHIYFFYRPRVQLEEVHSEDDVKNLHILLVPRPPAFAVPSPKSTSTGVHTKEEEREGKLKVLERGADAVPAPAPTEEAEKSSQHYRVITVGKKKLPDPGVGGKGRGRREMFWAVVTGVGDDLNGLEGSLGKKTYETKTRGERFNAPARLAGRGAYAIVKTGRGTPSSRASHLIYRLSHPSFDGKGDEELAPQEAMGIMEKGTFVLQLKNPLAPAAPGQPRGQSQKIEDYPAWILDEVFGRGGKRGKEPYGLRFAPCESVEMLDIVGAEVLLMAESKEKAEIDEASSEAENPWSDGRAEALSKVIENEESQESVEQIYQELGLNLAQFPPKAIDGHWI